MSRSPGRRIGIEIGLLAAALAAPGLPRSAGAVPQPYAPSGGPVGAEYIEAALGRILPPNWEVVEHWEGKVPSRWSGPAQAIYFRVENELVNVHHPDGFTYHPYIKLYFCPPDWSGMMDECDYYGDTLPSFLLGKNHEYKVFYQTRSTMTWDDPWTALAAAFDLTQPRVDRALRGGVDAQVRTRLAQRLATVSHELPEDVMDRILGLERNGSLLYLEYVATVSAPPAGEPGAPALAPEIREAIDREMRELTEELFRLFPEVTDVYLHRVCDNRLCDAVVDRAAQSLAQEKSF